MADNDQLLEKIKKVVREEVEVEAKKARNENSLHFLQLGNQMGRVENRLKDVEISNGRLEQGQAQTNERLSKLEDGQAHLITGGEAVAAGQKELQETVATKADIQDVKAEVVKKIKQHDKRLDALEEKEGLSNPYKH